MKEKIRAAFREKLGGEPEWIVRSPGRVNLIGEHTDYNDGFVMPLAVERATWIALRKRAEPGARLYSVDFSSWTESLPGKTQRKTASNWEQFLGGVTEEMGLCFPNLAGWEGVSCSDLPIAAGLSSSASFELAGARAYAAASGLAWEAKEMALLAHRVEVEWVGVNCGTMDQLAVALGRKDHALLIDCRSLEVRATPLPSGSCVVILDTSKARALADSAYNERRRQCEEAAERLGAKSLRDVSLEQFIDGEGELDPVLAKRARHVITENARTVEAMGAMEVQDASRLGELMNASHVSLRDDYEVSCRELDVMVEAAQEREECFGARMTGAGFGGCAVALVREEGLSAFVEAVSRRYQEATGLSPKLYATGAADGVEVLPGGG